MPAFGLADLRCFFSMGVPVSFRGVASYPDGAPVLGLFDRPVDLLLADQGYGGVALGQPELRLPCTAFAVMPTSKDTLTVDGTAYTVSTPLAEDDGSILVYKLKLVTQ